jgi:D-glycero-beta-D-manno-heptose-7-phosphate kinase
LKRLADAVDGLAGVRAVAVGDLMLDEYVWGDVRRISPEAPVPVVDVQGRSHVPGGAGNVAAGVIALGGSVTLGGVVGEDEHGARLRAALAERGVRCEGVLTANGRMTTTKTRVIAHSQQVVRTDVEHRQPLEGDLEARLVEWGTEALGDADVLILSDYAKGVLTPGATPRLIEQARSREIPVVVDPKGVDYTKYRGATILTPNVHDAERAATYPVESYDDLLIVAARLLELLPGASLLITRGADGMTLATGDRAIDVAAEARDVYDVTGAGDTVVAALAVALAAGLDLEDAVRLANAAAGVVVGKVGTATVTLDELRDRLEH